MILFQSDPALPTVKTTGAFVQTIRLMDGDRALGRAIWVASEASQGVVQLLDFWIDPILRRSGYGRRLIRGVIEQARSYHKFRGENLRRVWVGVGHKSQVVGRSFLTSEGFHHISTNGGLMQDEDQLIYVKSLD